jgi:transcriptional regulator with PAS, ATPase and Fis domain
LFKTAFPGLTEAKAPLVGSLRTRQEADAAQDLGPSRHRYKKILDVLPGGVIILDGDGRVQECNPSAQALLGEPLQGALWREVVERAVTPRPDDGHDISLHDGRRVNISTQALDGEPGQILLIKDVTETRRLLDQLSLHQRLFAQGDLAASLAQQIRTPLSAAILYLSNLSSSGFEPNIGRPFVGKTLASLKDLERLVEELMLFARGGEGIAVERPIREQGPHAIDMDGTVAVDPKTRAVLGLARRVAGSEATVLITGESGTGKEVLFRYIHAHSSRREGPAVAINCAAIPENMLEAMLFGYEKGAFTGAYKSSPGKFEQAQGGTLLLDEISEMALPLQAKLLRVLQEKEVERLGGSQLIPLNVRIVATSNRDMRAEVAAGRFREDLFYRLNVFPLHMPALRERRDDIVPMAEFLLTRAARTNRMTPPRLEDAARARLLEYAWPGNVRELDNVMQRALIVRTGGGIRAEDLAFEPIGNREMPGNPAADNAADVPEGLGEDLKHHEHGMILGALSEGGGSRMFAAKKLGISPRTLRYKLARMREAGLEIPGG